MSTHTQLHSMIHYIEKFTSVHYRNKNKANGNAIKKCIQRKNNKPVLSLKENLFKKFKNNKPFPTKCSELLSSTNLSVQ